MKTGLAHGVVDVSAAFVLEDFVGADDLAEVGFCYFFELWRLFVGVEGEGEAEVGGADLVACGLKASVSFSQNVI